MRRVPFLRLCRRRSQPNGWTIPIDSVAGYGDERLADAISVAVADAGSLDEAVVGLDARTGAISIYVDVDAPTFAAAFAEGRQAVADVLAQAGIEFPIDPDQVSD
jgi:hypothetical protein